MCTDVVSPFERTFRIRQSRPTQNEAAELQPAGHGADLHEPASQRQGGHRDPERLGVQSGRG